MRHHNSQLRFYSATLVRIYQDMVSAILPQNEIDADVATLQRRINNEGMSFLTKILPALGKSIDVSLANGTILDSKFSGFQKKPNTKLPNFMNRLFELVFRADGVPWFATWYSDLYDWCSSPVEVDMGYPMCESKYTREQLLFFSEVLTLDKKLGYSSVNDFRENGFNRYPGSHILNEVFSPTRVLTISLGDYTNACLLGRETELSSRREAVAVALRALRQVCYCFYKLNIPHTDEQEAKTLADFVTVDRELSFTTETLDPVSKIIQKQARHIICRVLANADPRSGIPKHGPGAVATGEKLPEKHHFKRDYTRLTSVFPLDEWFFCNQSHVCDSLQELQAMETLEVGTAKVVLVPKDSRGPRLISCEPLEYQWIQQSLNRVLVDTIESHPLTKGHVNFTDQEVNRNLALRSSLSYDWVTLDMKEASDRVSCNLVQSLFPATWWEHLFASRSAATQLPSKRVVQLQKFAPMGSAVCFPVEALIFWAISVSTLMITQNLPLRKAATKVYVYGDDIICDANYHGVIRSIMPKFDLMLNDSKCCVAGPFKESCGMDAYLGIPVTPTKIRSTWCDALEPSMIASYVDYSNEFYRCNMFESALFLEEQVQALFTARRRDPIPTVSSEDPSCIAFVRHHELPIPKNRALGLLIRRNRNRKTADRPFYQRHEVMGYRLESKLTITKTTGWPFLLRKLTELETKNRHPSFKDDTTGACSMLTGQYPIAHRVRLKRAWTPLI